MRAILAHRVERSRSATRQWFSGGFNISKQDFLSWLVFKSPLKTKPVIPLSIVRWTAVLSSHSGWKYYALSCTRDHWIPIFTHSHAQSWRTEALAKIIMAHYNISSTASSSDLPTVSASRLPKSLAVDRTSGFAHPNPPLLHNPSPSQSAP